MYWAGAGMIQALADILPLTAVVAVILFIAREIFELTKRHSANQRKLKSIKILITRECEQNLWVLISLHRILSRSREMLELDPVFGLDFIETPSGNKRYQFSYSDRNFSTGGVLP
jgi:hypothetical protein